MANAYQIDLVGTTFAGSTAFLSPDTVYTPLENFVQSGSFLVESPIFPSNFETTDANVFDIGLFVGNVFDIEVNSGEIQFASNTALHTYMGGNSSQLASIDVVEQTFDSLTGIWSITVGDIDTARVSQLNTFNSTSNILSAPKQILAGEIEIQFSSDGQQIQGTIELFGSGLIEPSTYAYFAEFSGSFLTAYTGIGEQSTGLVSSWFFRNSRGGH